MHTEKNFLGTDHLISGGGGGREGLKKDVSLLNLAKQIKCLQ